jgi:hypothetical protein
MAWIAAAVGLLGSFASSKAAEADKKDSQKHDFAMTGEEAKNARLNSMFDKEQDYYYQQLDRANKQRGMDLFRERSTITQWDPEHIDPNPRIVVPERPIYNEGMYKYVPEPEKEREPFSWKKKLLQPFYRVGEFGD